MSWTHTSIHQVYVADTSSGNPPCSVSMLWSRDHGLETRVHFAQVSVSRPEDPGLGLGLKTACLVLYACSTITVNCSTFKQLLCHQLELMQPVMWFRDHVLETRVHSSSFCPGLGLETWWPRSRDLKTQVSALIGLETWWPRSRSGDLKRSWQQHYSVFISATKRVYVRAEHTLSVLGTGPGVLWCWHWELQFHIL